MCNFSIFFFNDFTERLDGCLNKCGCLVKLYPRSKHGSTADPIWMSLNIFLIYNIYKLCCVCIDFYDLSVWCGCWFVVYIRRFIYKFLNVCPFDYTAVVGSGKVGP